MRAPDGRQLTFYTGSDGEAQVLVKWLMEGGSSLTYQQCASLVHDLRIALAERPWLNRYPSRIVLSRGGHGIIGCSIRQEEGEPTNINTHQTLRYEGLFWPQRRLSLADIFTDLNAAINHAQQQDPDAEVPGSWFSMKARSGADVSLSLVFDPLGFLPHITFMTWSSFYMLSMISTSSDNSELSFMVPYSLLKRM